MKLLVTVEDLFDNGVWQDACELLGINEWAVKEGMLSMDDQLEFTIEQAQKLHLIPSEAKP